MIPLQANEAVIKVNQGEVYTTAIEGVYTLVKTDKTHLTLLQDEVMILIEETIKVTL